MKHEEIDKKIGMPDIDREWTRFEAEVIGSQSIGQQPKRMLSRAAAIALLFALGLVAAASTFIIIRTHEEAAADKATTIGMQLEAEGIAENEAGITWNDDESRTQTFDNVELQDIASYLQHRYGIMPEFASEDVKHIRLYVTIDRNMQLTEVTDLLNNFQNVRLRTDGNRLIFE